MARIKKKDAAKPPEPPKAAPRRRWFPANLCIAIGLLLIAATSYPAWKHLIPDLTGRSEYKVRAEQIAITQPPQWVPANLVEQVLEHADLTGDLSLLDDGLTKRLAEAFALHPWVEEVVTVKKSFPAAVSVQLNYRRPVAMVQVKQGMYPVDPSGVLLPPEDFSVSETKLYPLITNVHSTPQGPAGTSWGDAAVIGAANLADVLSPHWKKLALAAIECPREASATQLRGDEVYVLLANGGSRILWGRVPGSDQPGELSTEQKIGRLKKYVADFGGFDRPNGPYEIDIRHWQEISRRTLTAERDDEALKRN